MGALTHNGEILQVLPADASQVNFNNTGTNLNSTQTENAIKEVNTKVNTNADDIDELNNNLSPMVNPISNWQLIENNTYEVLLKYKRSGNVVTGYVMTNHLGIALDYNQWTTLFSDLPFNLDGIQITQITQSSKICSFLISNSIQIISRSSVGVPAGDVFSFNFVGISTV